MNNKVCFTEQVNSQFCSINLHTLFRNSINSQFTSISISTSIKKCKKKNADEISRIHRKSENQISTQLNFIFCTPRWISNPQNDSASARQLAIRQKTPSVEIGTSVSGISLILSRQRPLADIFRRPHLLIYSDSIAAGVALRTAGFF